MPCSSEPSDSFGTIKCRETLNYSEGAFLQDADMRAKAEAARLAGTAGHVRTKGEAQVAPLRVHPGVRGGDRRAAGAEYVVQREGAGGLPSGEGDGLLPEDEDGRAGAGGCLRGEGRAIESPES